MQGANQLRVKSTTFPIFANLLKFKQVYFQINMSHYKNTSNTIGRSEIKPAQVHLRSTFKSNYYINYTLNLTKKYASFNHTKAL